MDEINNAAKDYQKFVDEEIDRQVEEEKKINSSFDNLPYDEELL